MGFLGSALGFVGDMVGMVNSNNQADKNRDMQRYFAKNAHQVEVADLKAAGLNPVLSATGGSGSAVPSGSMPPRAEISNPVTTAKDIDLKSATISNLKEQTKKIIADTAVSAADARRIGAIADKEEITKLGYTLARDLLLPRVTSTASDVAADIKKSGISIKMGKGDFQ